nr:AMP-binding protein [Ruegeria arenilitoris]
MKRTAQVAHVLQYNGVSPGDRIVVQAPKLADTIALYAASVQAGAVYLPLNIAYTLAELDYFISDAQPSMIVCDSRDEIEVVKLAVRSGAKLRTFGGVYPSLSSEADAQSCVFETVDRAPNDLAALLYTSGTTGRSKGAMLNHQNLLSNAQALVGLWGITNDDRLVHALPIFHTHGPFVAMNTSLLAGARVRLMQKFDLGAILDELPQSTLLMGVPTFNTRLLADDRFTKEITLLRPSGTSCRASNIRAAPNSSRNCRETLWEKFKRTCCTNGTRTWNCRRQNLSKPIQTLNQIKTFRSDTTLPFRLPNSLGDP